LAPWRRHWLASHTCRSPEDLTSCVQREEIASVPCWLVTRCRLSYHTSWRSYKVRSPTSVTKLAWSKNGRLQNKLESSQSPHTSAKAMLFARWQHYLRFCSGFPYAPLKAMVTKISKWSRIQDSFRITPKIKSLIVCAIPDIPSKFQKDPSITFWVILLTHRQTNRQTKSGKNITSLAEVII